MADEEELVLWLRMMVAKWVWSVGPRITSQKNICRQTSLQAEMGLVLLQYTAPISQKFCTISALLSFKTPDDMCLETRRSVKEANNGRAWVIEPEGINKDLNDLFRDKNTCLS